MSKDDTLGKLFASWDTDAPERPTPKKAPPDEKFTTIFSVADAGRWMGAMNIPTSWDATVNDGEESTHGPVTRKMFRSLQSDAGGYPEYIQTALSAVIRNTIGDDGPWGNYSEIVGVCIHDTTWFLLEELNFRVKKGTPWSKVIEEMYLRCVPEGSHDRAQLKQMDMYRTRRWRELRVEVLTAYAAKCMMCGRSYKEHGTAMHVDHIIPISREPRKAFHFTNLQILCEDCNLGKSNNYMDDWRPEK